MKKKQTKINKHVHDNVMMNFGLMMMVEVVMVNDDVNDYHYVNRDDDPPDHVHDLDLLLYPDLLNVDFVVDIV
jgi:hypothetical protein